MPDFRIRNRADAKATVAAYNDAVERDDRQTEAAALAALREANPAAVEAAERAADRKSR